MSEQVSDIDILELIPQRPPFVMVDRLVHFDPIISTSEMEIRENNIFFSEGCLSSVGLIENIAQTCAARIGYVNRLHHEAIRLGFIGAVKNLRIFRNPLQGEMLRTTITVKEEIFKMTLVDAEIKTGNETIVTAEMKIALSDTEAME